MPDRYEIPVDSLHKAVGLMENPDTFELGRYGFAIVLKNIPEEWYKNTSFSLDMNGKTYIFRNPSVTKDTQTGKQFVIWTRHSPKGYISMFPGRVPSPEFELEAANNLLGEVEANFLRARESREKEERLNSLQSAIEKAEARKKQNK